jgi:L-lysine exporter family protein LysE/ArgO
VPLLLAVLAGLGTGLGLIVAIGAQNAYLLRLGLTASRRTVAAAVAICAGSDAVLIVAGVLGVGALVHQVPLALVIARFLGGAFLIGYGALAARRALRPAGGALRADAGPEEEGPEVPARAGARPGAAAVLEAPRVAAPARALLAMALFTWANPHVYLDTVVLLGSVGNQQGPDLRWWWVAGAVAASCLWFSAIGFGGRLLGPVLARPGAWRVLDGGIAAVMLVLGVLLLLGR